MSWKAHISRHLKVLRFFACPESPSSRGVLQFYSRNYEELKILNPTFPFLVRTTENAMPAVTTELEWTTDDAVRFMLQTGRFRDDRGNPAEDRIEAAHAFLKSDWTELTRLRFRVPEFDPERPGLEAEDWPDDAKQAMEPYVAMKKAYKEAEAVLKSGPNDEYLRAENALLMCQRVDLWCAGPLEVERAVQHLYKLAKSRNNRETQFPDFIADYFPGAMDIQDD